MAEVKKPITDAAEIQKAQNARDFRNDSNWRKNYNNNSTKQSASNIAAQEKKKAMGIADVKSVTVGINNKKYTLSRDEIRGVQDLYKQSWQGQYGQDDEDQLNLRNGVMPRSFANSYKKGDKSLYDLGLPNSKYFENYLEAYRTYKEENDRIIADYKKKNARLGQFYTAVTKKWFDDEYKNGSYDPSKSIEGDVNTWDQRRQQQFFDMLDLPEWSDVKEMYDLTRRKTKVKDPSDYKSVQEYYEAKFDADQKNRAEAAKVDAADAKSLTTGKKGTEKTLGGIVGDDIVESERANQYSVNFTFDDFSDLYSNNLRKQLLTSNLVDEATGKAVEKTAWDVISDIDKANQMAEANSDPARYVQSYTGTDYGSMMQELATAGISKKSLKTARDEALARISGNPNLSDKEKKIQTYRVKKAEADARSKPFWDSFEVVRSALLAGKNKRRWEKERAEDFIKEYKTSSETPRDYQALLGEMKTKGYTDREIKKAYNMLASSEELQNDPIARQDLRNTYDEIHNGAYKAAQEIRYNYYKDRDDFTVESMENLTPGEVNEHGIPTGPEPASAREFWESATEGSFTPSTTVNNGSSKSTQDAIAQLNHALHSGTGGSVSIDAFRDAVEELHKLGVTAPVIRSAANAVLSSMSRAGQISSADVDGIVKSINDIVTQNEEQEHKEIFATALPTLEEAGYTPFDITQAFSRMGWSDALNEDDWARAYYTEYAIPEEMFSNADTRSEWRSMDEDERIVAAGEIWDALPEEQRAELTKDFVANTEYNPIINKDYGTQITSQWVGAWGKTAVGLIKGGLNIAQLVSTAFGNDPTKLAAAVATGQKLEGWDAFNAAVDMFNDVHGKLSMYGKAVDQDFLSDVISTGSDVFAEILRMQTMNFIGTGISNSIFKIAGVPFFETAAGTMAPQLTSVGKGLNILAKVAASVPFVSDATASYWSEALQNGADTKEAVAYSLICGFCEGAVEALNADRIFKNALGGDELAGKLIQSAQNGLSLSDFATRIKIFNMVANALGEGAEEGLSYIISLVMGNATFNSENKETFDFGELFKEAGMGTLVGLFANMASMSTYTVDDYLSDYFESHKINANDIEVGYAATLVSAMDEKQLDSLNVTANDLLSFSELKANYANQMQIQASLETHANEVNLKIEDAAKRKLSIAQSIQSLMKQMNETNDAKKKQQISAQIYGENGEGGLVAQLREATAAYEVATGKEVEELTHNRNTQAQAAENGAERIRRHYVALYYLTRDQVTAMSTSGKAQKDIAENEPKRAETEAAINDMMSSRILNPDELDAYIKQVGVTSEALEEARKLSDEAEAILQNLGNIMNSVRDGSAKTSEEANAMVQKMPAKELKSKRQAKKNTKKKQNKKNKQNKQDAPKKQSTPNAQQPQAQQQQEQVDQNKAGQATEPQPAVAQDVEYDSNGIPIPEAPPETDAYAQPYDLNDESFFMLNDMMKRFGSRSVDNGTAEDIRQRMNNGAVKLSEDTMRKVRSIAKRLGREVIFKDLNQAYGGLWDRNFIYINTYQVPNANGEEVSVADIARMVLAHEFQHSVRSMSSIALDSGDLLNSPEWIRFSDKILDLDVMQYNERLKQNGEEGNFTKEDRVNEKRLEYFIKSGGEFDEKGDPIFDKEYYRAKGKNVTMLSSENAIDEVVSSFVQYNMFMNEPFINMMVREESGIAGKALNLIQYAINKLKVKPGSEMSFLLDAQRLYAKAFAKSNESPTFYYRRFASYAMTDSEFRRSPEAQDMYRKYADAIRAKDMEECQRIVDDFANRMFKDSVAPRDENGRLLKLYHGTRSGGHTVFNEGVPVFTSLDRRVAMSYSNKRDKNALAENNLGLGGIYTFYADVRSPFVLDCGESNWQFIIPKELQGKFNSGNLEIVQVTMDSTPGLEEYTISYPSEDMSETIFDTEKDLVRKLERSYGKETAKSIVSYVKSQNEKNPDSILPVSIPLNIEWVSDLLGNSNPVYSIMEQDQNSIPFGISTDDYVAWAMAQTNPDGTPKYDSVLFKNVIDADERVEGGGLATNLVVFDPRNLKSADPYTWYWGDDGRKKLVNPLKRFNTSINNVLYSMDNEFQIPKNVENAESEYRDRLREIDRTLSELRSSGGSEQDISELMRERQSVQDELNTMRALSNAMKDPQFASKLRNGFNTANNSPRHIIDFGDGEGLLTADEINEAYRNADKRGKRAILSAIAEYSLKPSLARDNETGKLIVWNLPGDGSGWVTKATDGEGNAAYLDLRNPLIINDNSSDPSSIRLNGTAMDISSYVDDNGIHIVISADDGTKLHEMQFDYWDDCLKWAKETYGDNVAYLPGVFENPDMDATIYAFTAPNGNTLYSLSDVVDADFAERFAREGGYDGIILNNEETGDSSAFAVSPEQVHTLEDVPEATASSRFPQNDGNMYSFDGDANALELAHKMIRGKTAAEIDAMYLAGDKDKRQSIIYALANRAMLSSQYRDKSGNLFTMFHGTMMPGFTEFDPDKVDDLLSFFFTPDLTWATYVNGDDLVVKAQKNAIARIGGKSGAKFLEKYQENQKYVKVYDFAIRALRAKIKTAIESNENGIDEWDSAKHPILSYQTGAIYDVAESQSGDSIKECLIDEIGARYGSDAREEYEQGDFSYTYNMDTFEDDGFIEITINGGSLDGRSFLFSDELVNDPKKAFEFLREVYDKDLEPGEVSFFDNEYFDDEDADDYGFYLQAYGHFSKSEMLTVFNDLIDSDEKYLFDEVTSNYNVQILKSLMDGYDSDKLENAAEFVEKNRKKAEKLGYTDPKLEDVVNAASNGLAKFDPNAPKPTSDPSSVYRVALMGKNVLKVNARGRIWSDIPAHFIPGYNVTERTLSGLPEGVKEVGEVHVVINGTTASKSGKMRNFENTTIEVTDARTGELKTLFSVKDAFNELYQSDQSKAEEYLTSALGRMSLEDFTRFVRDYYSEEFAHRLSYSMHKDSKFDIIDMLEGDDGNYYVTNYGRLYNNDRFLTTRDVSQFAYDHGYDGYMIEDIEDYAGAGYDGVLEKLIEQEQGGVGTIAVVFDPHSIKSLDAETYGNDRKLILPSERFNLDNPDIRYSIDASMENYLGLSPDTMSRENIQKFGDALDRTNIVGEVSRMLSISSEWNAAGRKYGTIPEGMDPKVRLANVPQQTSPTNRVSKLMRTLLESAHITSQEETRLRQMILDEEIGTYEPVSRQDRIDAARETITNDFGGDVDRAFDSLQRSVQRNAITPDTIALAEVLLAEASNAHDVERVYEVAAELRTASTAVGQAVSQIAALKRASGVGQSYYIQNFVDRLNTHDYADDIASGRMKPITVSPDLLRDLMMATDAESRNQIVSKIYEEIGGQIPPTLTDTLRAWRYFAMLANPTTHVRNMIGNVMMRALGFGKDAIATKLENVMNPNGEKSHAILTKQDRTNMDAVAERLFHKHYDDIVQDGKFGIEMEINNYRNYFHTKLMNKLAKFNFNKLEDEDRMFLRPGFKDAFMQYVKANNLDVNHLTQAEEKHAVENAILQAKKNTFRNANQLATYLNKIAQINGLSHLVVEGLVPFKKTPMNILAQGINYSPVGIAKAVYDIARNKLDKAKGIEQMRKAPTEIVDEISSGLSGSLLMVLGMALSKLGILRGSGEDDEDYEKLLRENGEQAYSINIGGLSMSLSNIAPATIPLFMGVALSEYADKTGTDNALLEFVSAISSSANPMMDMTLLSSVNEALQSYSSNGLLGNIGNVAWASAKSYVGQYLPTLPSKLFDLADPTQRTTKSNAAANSADLDYFGRSLLKKTPLEATLEPYVDLHGRTVKHDSFDLWLADAASNLVSPGTIKVKQYDAADREIIRLVRSTGETEFVPDSPQKYLKVEGERYNLDAKQYTQFSKEYGQAIYSAINDLIYTQRYINASDPVRAEMLSDAVSNAKKVIRNMWKDRVSFKVEEPVSVPTPEQYDYELADMYIGE